MPGWLDNLMGIYDIFRLAAEGAEKVPWRWRLLGGAGAGAVIGAMSNDEDLTIGEKISRGALVGTGLGLGAGFALRGAGAMGAAGEGIGKMALTGKAAEMKALGAKNSWKALMKPGTLALAGAAAGAAIAPPGHRGTGALVGAGLGFAAKPAMSMYKGYEKLGNVYGAQTTAIMAAATVPLAASVMFGHATPTATGSAVPGIGGTIDYEPMSGNMQDRMVAMNATGDIVLGLNGRRHG